MAHAGLMADGEHYRSYTLHVLLQYTPASNTINKINRATRPTQTPVIAFLSSGSRNGREYLISVMSKAHSTSVRLGAGQKGVKTA